MSPYIGVLLTLVSIALYNMFSNVIYLFFGDLRSTRNFLEAPYRGLCVNIGARFARPKKKGLGISIII